MTSDPQTVDYAVIFPNGALRYGRCRTGESLRGVGHTYLDDVGTHHIGRLQVWFSHNSGDLPPNPTADRILSAMGYRHPTGWRGAVIISTKEDEDGTFPPLTRYVRETLNELAEQ